MGVESSYNCSNYLDDRPSLFVGLHRVPLGVSCVRHFREAGVHRAPLPLGGAVPDLATRAPLSETHLAAARLSPSASFRILQRPPLRRRHTSRPLPPSRTRRFGLGAWLPHHTRGPPSRSLTVLTGCSATSLRACCIPLPTLGFITFPPLPATTGGWGPWGASSSMPYPSERFPPEQPAPHHCTPCPLAVHQQRRWLDLEALLRSRSSVLPPRVAARGESVALLGFPFWSLASRRPALLPCRRSCAPGTARRPS